MKEQELRKRMCGGKKRYLYPYQAVGVANSMNAKDPAIKVNAYECPYCHYWHVGRQRENGDKK